MHGTVAATLLAALTAGAPALAQEFQLPPGSPSPAAPAAGPTDSNAPAPRTAPIPTPTPAPAPTPAASAPATPTPSASARPSARAPVRARPTETASPAATASAPPAAEPSDTPSLGEGAPILNGGPSAVPTETAAPVAQASPDRDWLLWIALAAGAVLLAAISFVIGRRSARAAPSYVEPEPEIEALVLTEELSPPPAAKARRQAKAEPARPAPEAEAAPLAEPAPPLIDIPAPGAGSDFGSEPLPLPAFAQRTDTTPFDIELVPQRMTMALINASLSYRLTILNRDMKPLGPLRISCDLISAHASLQAAEQLDPDPEQAWMSHDFEVLPPGEHLVVDGEVRLPRAEILPVRSGASQLFVPLIRFTVQSLAGADPETIGARVFVIGEEPDQPGAGLKPFRLNDGTRSYSRIGQREVTIAP